jgi:transcriptional antiterminator NusG
VPMTEEFEKARDEREQDAKWYIVHTYSGHENKVKRNIENLVENRGFKDDIFEVMVPTEEYYDTKGGTKQVKERKMFPGYVLIKMIINDVTWYLVRNTRGVTGFVGPGSKPVPLTDRETQRLGMRVKKSAEPIDVKPGDNVKVISGPFMDFVAKVDSVSDDRKKIKAYVFIFGAETLTELDVDDIEKV